jgi:uncharacterized protein (TIGR00730 family)
VTRPLSAVAVYCASSRGLDPAYALAAEATGTTLARRGIRLVYGGGHVGLMGVVADAVLAGGGEVHGVITRALAAAELAHAALTTLDVVETMHERKMVMADAADAFVMLPGGFGTLDEFFEVLTWTQLRIHDKACGILDVGGFWQPLVAQLDRAADRGLVRPEHRAMVLVDDDVDRLLDRLETWRPPSTDRLLDPTER